jgi:hypothetical protein
LVGQIVEIRNMNNIRFLYPITYVYIIALKYRRVHIIANQMENRTTTQMLSSYKMIIIDDAAKKAIINDSFSHILHVNRFFEERIIREIINNITNSNSKSL